MNQHTDKINADDFKVTAIEILDFNDYEEFKNLPDDPRKDISAQVQGWFNSTFFMFNFDHLKTCDKLELFAADNFQISDLTAAVCDYYGKINNVEDDDNIAVAMKGRIEEIIKEKSGAQKLYDDYIAANYTENEDGQWVKK